MKSSLRKLRGLALPQHRQKIAGVGDKERRSSADKDELTRATQDMKDMRSCYDTLLSAAAAATNSAYEFAEALRELGSCLLEKTALNDDEESGRVLLMLGKAQFELQKLVDSYRIHIIQTITTPSESLLKELQTVEEMKQQCDDKRDLYKFMLAAQKGKGNSRHAKGENLSSRELQDAHEAYDEEATLFVFRLKSLKQGQSRSLLTQASRHHAAQLNFFKRGAKSLEVVEPHVKVICEQQHIDYHFSGLEDDDTEDDEEEEDDYSFDDNDYAEVSFDYKQNPQDSDIVAKSVRNSMELDQMDYTITSASASAKEIQQENIVSNIPGFKSFSMQPNGSSQSAPIFADISEPSEKLTLRPASTRKFHTYALPTPSDAKRSNLTNLDRPASAARLENSGQHTHLWHSSPINQKNLMCDETPWSIRLSRAHSVLKESNVNSGPIRIPPPLAEGLSLPNPYLASDTKKIRRHAFSGPITGKAWLSRPRISSVDSIPSIEYPSDSGVSSANPSRQPSVSKISPSASPPLISSPKINELHALPRPPWNSARTSMPSSLITHSAPLAYGDKKPYSVSKKLSVASHRASPLPVPPGPISRSFSIPSSAQRTQAPSIAKLLVVNPDTSRDVTSPPLIPLSLDSFSKDHQNQS